MARQHAHRGAGGELLVEARQYRRLHARQRRDSARTKVRKESCSQERGSTRANAAAVRPRRAPEARKEARTGGCSTTASPLQ